MPSERRAYRDSEVSIEKSRGMREGLRGGLRRGLGGVLRGGLTTILK